MSSTGYRLRQVTDRLGPGARLNAPLGALNRVIYCHRGALDLSDGTHLIEDEAWYGSGEVAFTAGDDGAVLWRFELCADNADPTLLGADDGNAEIASTLQVDAELEGPDAGSGWIMRCDSVKFPMGGIAFTHVHQGPGIRVVREGQIRIDTGGESETYLPGQAWFEPGPDAVFAQTSELQCSRFIRVMILPEELKGKSSIQYVNAEDLDKPKSQRYKGYVDEPIDH